MRKGRKCPRVLFICAVLAVVPRSAAADCPAKPWDDVAEAQEVHRSVLPLLSSLPDYVQIRDVFENALNGDRAAVAPLMGLMSHVNVDAAKYSTILLGRFPGAGAWSLDAVLERTRAVHD